MQERNGVRQILTHQSEERRSAIQIPAGSPAVSRRYTSEHPVVVNLVNGLSRALPVRRRRLTQLNPWKLLEQAERQTGLADWGTLDFIPAFNRLVDSLNSEAELTPFGSMVMTRTLVGILETRLKIRRELVLHPEIQQLPITRPMFIVGLPRTGSTLLQRLLSQDPEVRAMMGWESIIPTPFENDPDNSQRIAEAERRIGMYNWLCPELRRVHEVVATQPEECTMLLQNSFMSPSFGGMAKVPSYVQWLVGQDRHRTYQEYKLQLQMLQFQSGGGRWLLKSPLHLWSLRELVHTFADAMVIQTHRDPINVIPSYCSLASIRRSLSSTSVDPTSIGEGMLTALQQMIEDSMDTRPALGEQRFFDVSYRELTANPFAVIEQLYGHFGIPFTSAAKNAMQHWLDLHPQHKHGAHRYSAEQFGMTENQITQTLQRYHQTFGSML